MENNFLQSLIIKAIVEEVDRMANSGELALIVKDGINEKKQSGREGGSIQ